jgi:hypothetical protein
MFFSFLIWTIIAARFEIGGEKDIKHLGYTQIVFVWLFDVFYSVAWSGLLVAYALEILPYRLRARGLMIMNFFIQVALTIGNQTNPIALANMPAKWNLFAFYTVCLSSQIHTLAIVWLTSVSSSAGF